MRLFLLGTAISALAALAAAVPLDGGLTSEETKHMKGTIISLAKAIKPSNCDVATAQVMSLHNMINDVTVEGHVDKETDSVKYMTMADGDKMVKQLWDIRREREKNGDKKGDKKNGDKKKGDKKKGKKFGRDAASPEPEPQKKKGGKGGKGGKAGKSKGGAKGGKGKGKPKGGKGKGKKVRMGRGEAEIERPGKLSCRSAHKILKVVREFAPNGIHVGTTKDDQCAYYIHPKDEKTLMSKFRRALMFSR